MSYAALDSTACVEVRVLEGSWFLDACPACGGDGYFIQDGTSKLIECLECHGVGLVDEFVTETERGTQ